MSVELVSAYVSLIPTLKTAGLPAIGDQAGASVGKRFSGGFAKATKVGLAVGVGGALAAFGAVVKTGFGEVKDASAGTAQLTAGIKSTNNAAHVTVKGLNDLASKVQNYSGQTDDSVVSAEKLLLTFTNIKNQGPNKIFDQATVAAADMAARMGGDASSNAIRLGKALNDPVKGITALTKVGVSFTAGQKKQVAQMVKTGNTVGAQKLILHELNKEFGGSAKAAGQSLPGQMARAKRSFEDFSQAIISKALPYVTKFADFIRAHWPQIKAVVGAVMSAVGAVLKETVAVIRNYVIPAVKAAVQWVVDHWPQIKAVFVAVWKFVRPIVYAFGNLLKTVWQSVLQPLVAWVKAHWPQIKTVMKVVFVAIGVAVVIVKQVLITAFNVIGGAIKVMAAVFHGAWVGISFVFNAIKSGIHLVHGVVSKVSHAISHAWGFITGGLESAWRFVKKIFDKILSAIQDVLDGIDQIRHPFSTRLPTGNIVGSAPKPTFGPAPAPSPPLVGHPRALGGPVIKGHPYVVGDGGRPELFVPESNGRIIPRVPTSNGIQTKLTAAAAREQHFHIYGITDPEAFAVAVARRQAMRVV